MPVRRLNDLYPIERQATVEMALTLIAAIIPITFGLIAFTEIAWTYHALATVTRQVPVMRRHIAGRMRAVRTSSIGCRPMRPHFQIAADGKRRRADPGQLLDAPIPTHIKASRFRVVAVVVPIVVPDSVTVSIIGYQFNHFFPAARFAAAAGCSVVSTTGCDRK